MFEIGRVCMKLAGRDAGMRCVVIDIVDKNTVVVDGETRRRKCNVLHLEPLDKKIELSKNAPAAEIERAMKELGFGYTKKSGKKDDKAKAPLRQRVKKSKPVAPVKPAKAAQAVHKADTKKE